MAAQTALKREAIEDIGIRVQGLVSEEQGYTGGAAMDELEDLLKITQAGSERVKTGQLKFLQDLANNREITTEEQNLFDQAFSDVLERQAARILGEEAERTEAAAVRQLAVDAGGRPRLWNMPRQAINKMSNALNSIDPENYVKVRLQRTLDSDIYEDLGKRGIKDGDIVDFLKSPEVKQIREAGGEEASGQIIDAAYRNFGLTRNPAIKIRPGQGTRPTAAGENPSIERQIAEQELEEAGIGRPPTPTGEGSGAAEEPLTADELAAQQQSSLLPSGEDLTEEELQAQLQELREGQGLQGGDEGALGEDVFGEVANFPERIPQPNRGGRFGINTMEEFEDFLSGGPSPIEEGAEMGENVVYSNVEKNLANNAEELELSEMNAWQGSKALVESWGENAALIGGLESGFIGGATGATVSGIFSGVNAAVAGAAAGEEGIVGAFAILGGSLGASAGVLMALGIAGATVAFGALVSFGAEMALMTLDDWFGWNLPMFNGPDYFSGSMQTQVLRVLNGTLDMDIVMSVDGQYFWYNGEEYAVADLPRILGTRFVEKFPERIDPILQSLYEKSDFYKDSGYLTYQQFIRSDRPAVTAFVNAIQAKANELRGEGQEFLQQTLTPEQMRRKEEIQGEIQKIRGGSIPEILESGGSGIVAEHHPVNIYKLNQAVHVMDQIEHQTYNSRGEIVAHPYLKPIETVAEGLQQQEVSQMEQVQQQAFDQLQQEASAAEAKGERPATDPRIV